MFTLVKHCAGLCPANAEMDCTLSRSVKKFVKIVSGKFQDGLYFVQNCGTLSDESQ